MKSVICMLLICCTFIQVYANQPDWYPTDSDAVLRKCKSEFPISSQTIDEIKNGQMNDSPALRSLLLCNANGMNVYTSGKGLDADRLSYIYYQIGDRRCNRELVHECVNRHKNLQPEDAMVFNTMKCIIESEYKFKNVSKWNGGCD